MEKGMQKKTALDLTARNVIHEHEIRRKRHMKSSLLQYSDSANATFHNLSRMQPDLGQSYNLNN
jgi:hypothetical protein